MDEQQIYTALYEAYLHGYIEINHKRVLTDVLRVPQTFYSEKENVALRAIATLIATAPGADVQTAAADLRVHDITQVERYVSKSGNTTWKAFDKDGAVVYLRQAHREMLEAASIWSGLNAMPEGVTWEVDDAQIHTVADGDFRKPVQFDGNWQFSVAISPEDDDGGLPANQANIIQWATELTNGDFLVLYTETTGLHNAHPVEIAVIDQDGNVLFNERIFPPDGVRIGREAAKVHGITQQVLEGFGAKKFADVADELTQVIAGKRVAIYNFNEKRAATSARSGTATEINNRGPTDSIAEMEINIMARILALFNEKGGVGKTTQAVHIAAGLVRRDKSVLLVDADQQAHCSVHLNMPKRDSFFQVMANDAPFDDSTVMVVPEDRYLAPGEVCDGLLALLPGNASTRGIPNMIVDAFMLEERRAEIDEVFDYVIFDMSPSISILHTCILIASDAVLWVTKPAALDMDGLNESITHYDRTNKARVRAGIPELMMLGVVPMMYEGYAVTGDNSDSEAARSLRGTRANNAAISQLTKRFRNAVWPCVPHRTVWQQAAFARKTLWAFQPDCEEAAYEAELVRRVERSL